jgi:hypothetical protein
LDNLATTTDLAGGAAELVAVSDDPGIVARVREIVASSTGLDRAKRVSALLEAYIDSDSGELVLYWPTDWGVAWRQNRLEADSLTWILGWYTIRVEDMLARSGRDPEDVWQYMSKERVGLAQETVETIVWVSRHWTPDEVHWGMSFGMHHQVTRGWLSRQQQHELLDECEQNEWTRAQLRQVMKERWPKPGYVPPGRILVNGMIVEEGDPLVMRDQVAALLHEMLGERAPWAGAKIVTWLLSDDLEARQFLALLTELRAQGGPSYDDDEDALAGIPDED